MFIFPLNGFSNLVNSAPAVSIEFSGKALKCFSLLQNSIKFLLPVYCIIVGFLTSPVGR